MIIFILDLLCAIIWGFDGIILAREDESPIGLAITCFLLCLIFVLKTILDFRTL